MSSLGPATMSIEGRERGGSVTHSKHPQHGCVTVPERQPFMHVSSKEYITFERYEANFFEGTFFETKIPDARNSVVERKIPLSALSSSSDGWMTMVRETRRRPVASSNVTDGTLRGSNA
jgi:hypothetical protein